MAVSSNAEKEAVAEAAWGPAATTLRRIWRVCCVATMTILELAGPRI
jgi:hypothetical protein